MDGMGWMDGMDGIGSPGGRGYRAPYGANKVQEGATNVAECSLRCDLPD